MEHFREISFREHFSLIEETIWLQEEGNTSPFFENNFSFKASLLFFPPFKSLFESCHPWLEKGVTLWLPLKKYFFVNIVPCPDIPDWTMFFQSLANQQTSMLDKYFFYMLHWALSTETNFYKFWNLGLQASTYEVCDRTCMPLHTPETLEASKKSTPCLIKKASRCAADRMSKTTTFFIFHFL